MSRQVEKDGKTVTASLDFDYKPNGLMSSMTYRTSGSPSAGQLAGGVYLLPGRQLRRQRGRLEDEHLPTAPGHHLGRPRDDLYALLHGRRGTGVEDGLKFMLNPAAFARLENDPDVGDPLTASDEKLAQYADFYYEYDLTAATPSRRSPAAGC